MTTGGTGLTPRDVTPQATQAVVDYEESRASPRRCARSGARRRRWPTCRAGLARRIRGRCLIVNLPGSPNGAIESLDAIAPVFDHALETLAGPYDHGA